MKLYAYCLAENLDTLGDSQRGISGAAVRLLKIDDVAVLVRPDGYVAWDSADRAGLTAAVQAVIGVRELVS